MKNKKNKNTKKKRKRKKNRNNKKYKKDRTNSVPHALDRVFYLEEKETSAA